MLRIALEIQSGIRRDVYGQKEIANAGKILRALRDTFGEETACEWVRRTFTLLQQEEILFCGLCEQGTCKREAKTTAIYGEKWQTTCKKYSAGCPMQYLWEERENMGASQGRESSEQLTRQLSEVVHELSQETAPTTVFMCCVWEAFQSEKFMQQSLSTIAESEEAREGTAADAERSVGKAIVVNCLTPWDCQSKRIFDVNGKYPTLQAMDSGGANNTAIAIDSNCQDSRFKLTGQVVPTIPAKAGTGENNGPMLAIPDKAYCIQGSMVGRADKNGPQGDGINEEGKAATLEANMPGNVISYGADLSQKAEGICFKEEIATCVNTGTHGGHGNNVITYQKVTGPLMANSYPGSYTGQDAYTDMLVAKPLSAQPQLRHREDMDTLITQHYSVRRLTPLECERLQNFPDGWTDIPGASDSARYKALGNSLAVVCAEYVLEGIAEHAFVQNMNFG